MRVLLLCICICLLSCSKEEEPKKPTDVLNKSVVEGDYIGTLNSQIVNFEVSLRIRKIADTKYNIELFESSNFRPSYNSDGVTAEVKGILELNGSEYCARLNLKSDFPECTGVYRGCGTRSNDIGEFTLEMEFSEICDGESFDGNFVYTWIKIRNP